MPSSCLKTYVYMHCEVLNNKVKEGSMIRHRSAYSIIILVTIETMASSLLVGLAPVTQAASASTPAAGPETVVSPVQSCDDAYDATGIGGAGVGQVAAIGNGLYSFSIKFNPEFIASLPPTTDFLWGEAQVFVDGIYAFQVAAGHERPLAQSFHGRLKLQGRAYGKANRDRIQRGQILSFKIALLLIDPASGTFYPGHGRITCRL